MTKLLVHGGAANELAPALATAKLQATANSYKTAISKKASAIDMVEAAVAAQELEADLNAGVGSVVQMDGRIRMDAAICNSAGRYGAVIQLEHVTTPIKVARRVLDIGYHSILSGDGARAFATEQGFISESAFTQKTLEAYRQDRIQYPELSYAALSGNIDDINVKKLSTVGAVAIDDEGNLAAACSTGGTRFCYPGRVGDTPIFGAGLYCSKYVAVAMTGEGDKILRRLTSKRVEELFLATGSLQRAADEAIADLLAVEKGYGGIIAVAHTGEAVIAHSTKFMATAQG